MIWFLRRLSGVGIRWMERQQDAWCLQLESELASWVIDFGDDTEDIL